LAVSKHCPRPLVVFIDEIDALRDEVLLSALRQLRAGYPLRPGLFPWSAALVELRDVRDYEVSGREAGRLGTASPFNIKVESLTLSNFTLEEITELYGQHTDYLDGLGLSTGWLVIFDERSAAGTVAARTRRAVARSPAGRELTIIYA
jgi:hypothetical protein